MERQEKYIQALDTEEMRKMSVKERAAEKERLMAELHARCALFHLALRVASPRVRLERGTEERVERAGVRAFHLEGSPCSPCSPHPRPVAYLTWWWGCCTPGSHSPFNCPSKPRPHP